MHAIARPFLVHFLALLLLALAPLAQAAAQAPDVNALQIDSDAGLDAGAQLQLRLEGSPRGRASIRIPHSNILVPLRETAPGVYRGDHTVRRIDRIDPTGVLRASITVGNQTATHNFAFPPAFVALARQPQQQARASQPQLALPQTQVLGSQGPLPLQVLSPSNNASIDTRMTEVRGRTAPNAEVQVKVDAVPPLIGQRLGVAQQLLNETVKADAQGNFSVRFDPRGLPVPGTRYEILLSVGSGVQAAETRLVLLQRG